MKNKPNTIGILGAVISIVGSLSLATYFLITGVALIKFTTLFTGKHTKMGMGIFFLILSILSFLSMIFNIIFLTKYSMKIPAGLCAIFLVE